MESMYWHDGDWTSERRPILGLSDNSFWMGNSVFDGARAYDNIIPDLDLHCERLLRSAVHMLMKPTMDAATLASICRAGVAHFEPGAELYIRPMFYARGGFIVPDPDTTECGIVIHRAPLPSRDGFSACSAPFRREPGASTMPTSWNTTTPRRRTRRAARRSRSERCSAAWAPSGAPGAWRCIRSAGAAPPAHTRSS